MSSPTYRSGSGSRAISFHHQTLFLTAYAERIHADIRVDHQWAVPSMLTATRGRSGYPCKSKLVL